MDIVDFRDKYEHDGYSELCKYVYEEVNVLKENLYVFQILDVVRKIEDLDFNVFKKENAKYIKLCGYND